jgi:[protein-PII] uridylyltransferase
VAPRVWSIRPRADSEGRVLDVPDHSGAAPTGTAGAVGDPGGLADLVERLSALRRDGAGRDALRRATVEALTAANLAERARIAATLADRPFDAGPALAAYSALADLLVRTALHVSQTVLHPKPNPTSAERMALLAVGGFGRAEMAPFSDIDLLFLTPWKQTAWGESVIESTLYILWDLKLKVGHSVRTAADCLRLARSDFTIRTALLEQRYLSGDRDLADDLDRRLWSELFARTGAEFVEAKLDERAERHRRNGGSRYLVEPNVKEGKGGLRDLQTMYWIAKYLNRARSQDELVALGVFSEAEYRIFREAEDFLWAVRCHLHLAAGRASEQLTFDMQVEIAVKLGFRDADGLRGVERFMQRYFTHARHAGELTRIFLSALEERHVKKGPGLARRLRNAFAATPPALSEGYVVRHGRLDLTDPGLLARRPVAILELFREGLRTGYMVHPDALRAVSASLHLIDDDLRADPAANALFLSLLLDYRDPERALRRMNETGVLGRFIPDFGRIVAMMQFNMYHHYTVDEHIIQCIATLQQVEAGTLAGELPVASEILRKGVNRRVLYVALMLHDIGKGLPQDHSVAGAAIARELCPRLGLPPDECEAVEWLVANHLLMSDVAQKRDLADPRTVGAFAAQVRSPTLLRLLLVLTVCDIRGVGPGVWNNWKAMLLRALYRQTLEQLTGDVARTGTPERLAEAQSALKALLTGQDAAAIEAELARHYAPYWLGLDPATQAVFAGLIPRIKDDEPVSDIAPDPSRDATRACFVMPDHPGIFSRFAGALALAGANVVDARTYTTRDGIATAVFWIQDREGKPYEDARLARLRRAIGQTLKGEVVARDALRARDRLKKREKDFVVPTNITFDNEGSEIFTIIEVDTRDRPGLLHDLTRTLAASSISISSAIIATYGEQAVDSFYVKDLFGLKIHSKSKQRAVADKLRAAIRQGAERAEA